MGALDLGGTYIDQPEFFPHPLATDLIQYRLERRELQLWVNLDDKVRPPPAKY